MVVCTFFVNEVCASPKLEDSTNLKNVNNMDRLFLLFIAVGLAYGVGYIGRSRKIGFWLAFIISLLNVVVGLIIVLCSKKIENTESND